MEPRAARPRRIPFLGAVLIACSLGCAPALEIFLSRHLVDSSDYIRAVPVLLASGLSLVLPTFMTYLALRVAHPLPMSCVAISFFAAAWTTFIKLLPHGRFLYLVSILPSTGPVLEVAASACKVGALVAVVPLRRPALASYFKCLRGTPMAPGFGSPGYGT